MYPMTNKALAPAMQFPTICPFDLGKMALNKRESRENTIFGTLIVRKVIRKIPKRFMDSGFALKLPNTYTIPNRRRMLGIQ
jgi:hypothetical protein